MSMQTAACCRSVEKWWLCMPTHALVHDPWCANYDPAGGSDDQEASAPQALSDQRVSAAGTGAGHDEHQRVKCQRCIDNQFQDALGRIQCHLHHLAGHDRETVERAPNHDQGPRCKWVNIGIDAASDRCRSTVL